jgi:hypothetical protein
VYREYINIIYFVSKENINKLYDLILESIGKKNCTLISGIDILLAILDYAVNMK